MRLMSIGDGLFSNTARKNIMIWIQLIDIKIYHLIEDVIRMNILMNFYLILLLRNE